MIGLMEPEICTKMLTKLSEKVGVKFPATHGYSMIKFANLNDAFLKVFFNCKQAQQKAITAAKRKEKEKQEQRRRNLKNWKA